MVRLLALWAAVLAALLLVFIVREERLSTRGMVPLGRLRRFWLGAERRRAPRYRVNWSVRYERLESPPTHGGGHTRDVSQTGAGLTLREKLPIGSLIRVEVLSPQEKNPLQMTAEVIWLKEVAPAGEGAGSARQFFVGIRFHRLNPQIEQRIVQALHGHPSF